MGNLQKLEKSLLFSLEVVEEEARGILAQAA